MVTNGRFKASEAADAVWAPSHAGVITIKESTGANNRVRSLFERDGKKRMSKRDGMSGHPMSKHMGAVSQALEPTNRR